MDAIWRIIQLVILLTGIYYSSIIALVYIAL